MKKIKKKVVVLGGGTGQGNLLRGFKNKDDVDLTAVVAVSDDGGGSGTIRTEMRMLPPGDIRNCLISLSNMDPTMEKLMNHRFAYGSLKGQNFGNLFILALNEIFGDFQIAIDQVSEMISVRGKVLPASPEMIRLMAVLENDNVVIGESQIARTCLEQSTHVKKIEIIPEKPEATAQVLEHIQEADIIIIGPGSLYTSLLPNLLIPEIKEAILKSSAKKVYICNLMTENGETDHLDIYQHVELIQKTLDYHLQYVVINTSPISAEIQHNYDREQKTILYPAAEDIRRMNEIGVQSIRGEFAVETDYGAMMHDSDKVVRTILKLLQSRRSQ
ncbi:gluconeogenesis factor YvcK family protein [Filifactor villosus]|uniref:Putative gluconeogenesis factor n=1 Tax=Filifactor villosus TaxID=29374 RepID=A0ABV9QJ77_9FIRM